MFLLNAINLHIFPIVCVPEQIDVPKVLSMWCVCIVISISSSFFRINFCPVHLILAQHDLPWAIQCMNSSSFDVPSIYVYVCV